MAHASEEQYGGSEDPARLLEEPRPVRAGEPRLDWRRGFLASDGLLILLGAWLVASPFVLPYGDGDGWWLPVLSGALIVVVSAAALAEIIPRPVAAWTVVGIAVVLFIAGLALADSSVSSWNAAAGGALASFLAIMAAAASSNRSSRPPPASIDLPPPEPE